MVFFACSSQANCIFETSKKTQELDKSAWQIFHGAIQLPKNIAKLHYKWPSLRQNVLLHPA